MDNLNTNGGFQPVTLNEALTYNQSNHREIRRDIVYATVCACAVVTVAGSIYLKNKELDYKYTIPKE